MASLIRTIDWSTTPLGPVSSWSPTLRMMVRFLVANRFPLLLWWGPDYCQIYNDAYRPILGSKHPRSLGQPTRECWHEIWDVLGPLIDTPYRGGPPTWMEDLALEINRHGFLEETHFTVAYSPVPDESASSGIGGVLATVHEITEKVVGERRIRALRDLGAEALEAKTAEDACEAAAETIQNYPKDIPFALVYLIEPDGSRARLACAPGLEEDTPVCPRFVDLTSPSQADVWPLAAVAHGETHALVEDLAARFGSEAAPGPWADPPRQAVVLPIRSNVPHKLAGFLVAGISSRLQFDDSYRGFLELAAGQIATAIASARAYEEERRRAEALAEIDRAKTAFFSNVSHEFRTPLTLMLGPLEESLERSHSDPEERERLTLVHRNGLRMLKLVNTLLDFSRIEAGRARAAFRPTDLPALTADLASAFRSAIERAGLELVVACPPQNEQAWVDPEMWEKVVLNLLSNAFKYTFEGRIEVRLELEENSWRLTVSDTGIGIEAQELPQIFDRFHRVEGARGRSYEGSGIGLALVRELARLHDGSVSASSSPGRGTTFTVSLPRGTAHFEEDPVTRHEAVQAAEMARAYVEEALRWLPDSPQPLESSECPESPGSPGSIAAPAAPEPMRDRNGRDSVPPRILLADDNADLRDYVRRLLAPQYDVVCVTDGEAALEAIAIKPPDLVLSDVMMPRLDGVGLLRALRGDPKTRAIPVILLSARAGEDSRVEGLAVGADDYLVKPFSPRELLARVGARLAETARHGAESRVRDVLDTIPDGFAAFDAVGRYTYTNAAIRRLWGEQGRSVDVLGKHLYEAFPDARGTDPGDAFERAMRDRVPTESEAYYEPYGRWLLVRYFPTEDGGLMAFTQDITARKLAEERVREEERRKDEFLATLAHEMRNPLAPIRNAIGVLNAVGTESPDAVWARGVIDRQVGLMARLLEDLLDVSRIARNRLELRKERVTLAAVVQRSLEASRPVIDAAGHALTVTLPQEDLWLDADPLRLSQVFSNLLNNAAKFTPARGQISIRARSEGTEVVVSVGDDGMGIDPQLLPRIFDMFVQAAPTLDQPDSGLGIGLSLVRGIVKAHGGRVQAKSLGTGRGSEFVVRLPRRPAPVPTTGAAPRAPHSDDFEMRQAQLAPLPGAKILIADDNVDSGDSLAMVLTLAGHDVHVVRDGDQAIEAAARIRPDVAVLDIGMPSMNGYEAAQRIRAFEWGRDITLIALTGWGQRQDQERAMRAGFDLHLVKPVEAAALDTVLRRVLGEAGALDSEPL